MNTLTHIGRITHLHSRLACLILALGSLMAGEALCAPKHDPLERAYLKELTFLKAQKSSLNLRLKTAKERGAERISKEEREIARLERELLSLQRSSASLEERLRNAGDTQRAEDELESAYSTLRQARRVLGDFKVEIPPLPTTDPSAEQVSAVISKLIEASSAALDQAAQINTRPGQFFDLSGVERSGQIIEIGDVARVGQSEDLELIGPLVPAGAGRFRLWPLFEDDEPDLIAQRSRALIDHSAQSDAQDPSLVTLFLFESQDRGLVRRPERGFEDELKAGGPIGYVIIALGTLALILALIRSLILINLGRGGERWIETTSEPLARGDLSHACTLIQSAPSAIGRVLHATLEGLSMSGREGAEEAGFAALLKERERLERFGTLITVTASIAPLLGLLGTVSGMIATFDVITEFGTGDPRLLSGGISEALVTTRLGLIVAIPSLLLGALLNGKCTQITERLQLAMLSVLNVWTLNAPAVAASQAEEPSSTSSAQELPGGC